MKRFLLVILFFISNAFLVYGDNFKKGKDAFSRGKYEKAFNLFDSSAKKGNTASQVELGNMYLIGRGVTQSYFEAFKLFKLAAEDNHPIAQYKLGLMYRDGKSINQDYAEAFRLFKLSAEQDYSKAQHAIGLLYQNGSGVNQDYMQAIKWILVSANNGYPPSQQLRNETRYFKWIKLAAEQGSINAQNFLGACFYLGINTNQSFSEAATWYKKSAELGNDSAQNILGAMNENGKGIPKNYIEANKWYTISQDSGNTYGALYRKKIESQMNSSEIEISQKLAKKWQEKHKIN